MKRDASATTSYNIRAQCLKELYYNAASAIKNLAFAKEKA
jgi:hypothetical protein